MDQLRERATTLLSFNVPLHMRSDIENCNFVAGLIERKLKRKLESLKKRKKVSVHVPLLINPKIPSLYLVRKDSKFRIEEFIIVSIDLSSKGIRYASPNAKKNHRVRTSIHYAAPNAKKNH